MGRDENRQQPLELLGLLSTGPKGKEKIRVDRMVLRSGLHSDTVSAAEDPVQPLVPLFLKLPQRRNPEMESRRAAIAGYGIALDLDRVHRHPHNLS